MRAAIAGSLFLIAAAGGAMAQHGHGGYGGFGGGIMLQFPPPQHQTKPGDHTPPHYVPIRPHRPPLRRPPPDVIIEYEDGPPPEYIERRPPPKQVKKKPPPKKKKEPAPVETVKAQDLEQIPPGEIRIARPKEEIDTDKALKLLLAKGYPDAVFVIGQDGFVQTRNIKTGALLMSTVAFTDGEWASFTPEGFFEGSARGPEFLLLGTRGPAARFIDVFMALFRPDLVRERGLGDPRGLVAQGANEISLQRVADSGPAPRVALRKPKTIAADAEEFTAEVDLTDIGGGAGQIEWRVNGVTMGVDRVADLGSNVSQLVRRTFLLEPGDNRIEVLAYNGQDLIASQPAAITVTRKAPPSKDGPVLHVVALGVNDYADAKLKLDFAVSDARAISGALKSAQPKIEITPVENKDATEANLERVFTEVGKKVKPGDTFVFFAAGHGKTLDGRYFFVPQDMTYDGDASLRAGGLTQENFQQWFARIPARRSLLIYDTSESATLTGDVLETHAAEQDAASQKLSRATGRTVLAASREAALEGYRGHGVMTYALLEGLGSGDTDSNGTISVSELSAFVGAKVPEISQEAFKVKQIPQIRVSGEDFALVKKTAGIATSAEVTKAAAQ